jgi:aarF domain-containing kinase
MADERPPQRRSSRVPAGRIERLARFGWMAGTFAAGGVIEGTKRLFGGDTVAAASALLVPENAKRLAQQLARMRGAAMKLGQLLSLESDDILPPAFAEALASLRASADAMPPSQVRRVLGREFGKGC